MIAKCPFCGGEPFVRVTRRADNGECKGFYIMCRRCEAETKIYETMQEAVEIWNRRYKSDCTQQT